jgi:hypothetical protein
MSNSILRRGLVAQLFIAGLGTVTAAQQAAKLQGFATAEAAAAALTDAVRRGDNKALAAMLGGNWTDFVLSEQDASDSGRFHYLAAWDENHVVTVTDSTKATVAVGKDGWTLPIPIVKDGAEWRFDVTAGYKEIQARQFGYDELGAIQTLLAIADAQYDYVETDPMKTGWPQYARRLTSSPGKKDGLYWPSAPGEPPSPLGETVANSQPDGSAPGGHYGYNYRLLHAQGPAAPGGAHDYLVNGRMIGGFAAMAWPVRYGETGVMTFIISYNGVVYQQDLGEDTAQRATSIAAFNPDKGWEKADPTPP